MSLVNQLPPHRINKTLDFFSVYRKDEHEDYIYGQRRERKIGLFHFAPGAHTLRLVCVGVNPLSHDPETGRAGYNLSADVLSVRRLHLVDTEAWIRRVIEQENAGGQK